MGNFLGGVLLPLLLLIAALLEWSLISLVDLSAFFIIQFTSSQIGFRFEQRRFLSWFIVTFSFLAILVQLVFHVIWLVEGEEWTVSEAWWAKLIGFVSVEPWKTSVVYFLVIQLAAALVALLEIYGRRFGLESLDQWQGSCWGKFSLYIDRLGSHLRVACCLLLPAVQLVLGISYPSWVSLPFFIGSCVGLVDWSLTSNFLGLFRWWRPLLIYASFCILLLYIYQLPVAYPEMVEVAASFVGFYKVSAVPEWPKITSGLSLLVFYFMLSSVKCDLEEMDSILSMQENNLGEQLLPSRHSFFIRKSRSGVRHTNVLLRGAVFRNFSINFFTYGFPVLLLALSFWSFNFASICAFGLLAYVGYILYAFPSLFHLHRLNGLLLVFILLWAASTYVFNVLFIVLNKKMSKDMEIWETIGLWHYPIPGFFLLAQFCLGILVAMGNLVNNSVFLYLSDGDGRYCNEDSGEGKEETKVLIVATIAWGLRKCSHAISLALIFLLAMKPGFIHAIYVVFFLVYLLSHTISRRMRQFLILLCEAHFAMLYILKLNLMSKALEKKGSLVLEILSQLGVLDTASPWDFVKIAVLGCFCAVQNQGSKLLFSLSEIVQHTSHPPLGFSVLRAGLKKSVLLSVYTSPNAQDGQSSNSHEKWIATYLSAIGHKFLSAYRSCGTYIAFMTILLVVYLMTPNYISFGYLFFLLLWIIGRQLVERTRRRLWFPLKVYGILVFIFVYTLSIFSTFETWMSKMIDLYHDLGFNPSSSLLDNVWEPLAVLIVMQMFSYERRQSRYVNIFDDSDSSEHGFCGFIRRFLIWHSDKILSLAVFYASLSPISLFGFIYLLGLVVFSTFPKLSRVPSKLFLLYTGVLVISEYLFQMWGRQAQMFPGQKHFSLALILGFRLFEPGFCGLESGLRGKILVIVACTLQYNIFHWLEKMPRPLVNRGKWEEPCILFVSVERAPTNNSMATEETKPLLNPSLLPVRRRSMTASSCPSLGSSSYESINDVYHEIGKSENHSGRYSFGYIWGSSRESQKWNKKWIATLRKERFEIQKATLKIYMKFWIENIARLLGLEINMVALLLASFALLNVVSMFYIACLIACILLSRQVIRRLWPIFFLSFASILVIEYFAIWNHLMPWNHPASSETKVLCHDCWRHSNIYFNYCEKCWLGIIVDDPRMLISYYMVFIFASFKLRSDHLDSFSDSHAYRHMLSQRKNASVWRDLSFETKSLWTFLDYVRLYSYCHLLDIVLALILITGTLEYDILHLGYLGFALLFFRMRLEILKKKNRIFKFLRMYNFALIVLSLAYQSPFLGNVSSGRCQGTDYIYEVIGFYKYDYGFRITSRSALVEIIIFVLVSIQSYIFCSREFDYVSRYLEAEQIGAIVHEQEKKAARKTAQLQHIRKSEEQKRQRNLQVEKMKSEMLNLQIQLNRMTSIEKCVDASPKSEGARRRRKASPSPDKIEGDRRKKEQDILTESLTQSDFVIPDSKKNESMPSMISEMHYSSLSKRPDSLSAGGSVRHLLDPSCEITEVDEKAFNTLRNESPKERENDLVRENPLISAVQLIGDGVSQVQTLGNQAVTNIVSFLNIEHEESDSNGHSSAEDGIYDEIQSQNYPRDYHLDQMSSTRSFSESTSSERASLQLGRIFRHIWGQMQSNNDIVCYCCFVLVFLWNFSLLSMVYLAALFLYALCVNSGPGFMFWIIMLIYSEVNILLQYLYQIIIQHCGPNIHSRLLLKLGFPAHQIGSSFVISTLPLFLVYISTLLQSSITAKDGEWESTIEFKILKKRNVYHAKVKDDSSWRQKVMVLFSSIMDVIKAIGWSCLRYWKSLTWGSEAPPYFVQLSMKVDEWPEDGIQPVRIESGINRLLVAAHQERCKENIPSSSHHPSRVRVQSIERSQENPNVALAVFEVGYASPATGCLTTEWYRSLTPAADVATEIRKALSAGLVEEIRFPYPIISVIGGGKREVDLYAYIFGADLAVFFLVAIFYQSVIKNNSKFIVVYQLEDQFPKEFVFILMVIFFLIVLDRIIYLCSFATGKVIFYLFNLILFTYSITEYAWNMEPSHLCVGGFALRAIYLTKAVSLALQALQLCYGVPHKSTLYRQFLTSKVAQINYLGFRLYRVLPFLYELRCVLDWSCTSTSLTIYDWLKLEDIHASLYLVKCDADLNRANHKQGEKQTKMTKFCSGICLFFILMCVIWAPMLMYSSGNPTNIANPIKDVSVQIDINADSGRLTLFQTTLCERIPWQDLHMDVPEGYLDSYNVDDIQLICCQADASTVWLIPQVVQARFMGTLDGKMYIIFSWVFTRDRPKGKEMVKYEIFVKDTNPWAVKEVLNGTRDSFRINNIYPRYFRVTGSGEVRHLEREVNMVSGDLQLNHGNPSWWSFHDANASEIASCGGLTGPGAVIVSEETPQGILGETLSKFSIWGIYITFVLAVGRFIRIQTSDLRMRIPYENLPSCDRLMAICEDIYAARAEGELEVEEVLYWTLINIYRSPHMLLEYTKPD